MIADCKNVRCVNTQEGAASCTREVRMGLRQRMGGTQKGHRGHCQALSKWWWAGAAWSCRMRNTMERSLWVPLGKPLLLSWRVPKPAVALDLGPQRWP